MSLVTIEISKDLWLYLNRLRESPQESEQDIIIKIIEQLETIMNQQAPIEKPKPKTIDEEYDEEMDKLNEAKQTLADLKKKDKKIVMEIND